MLNLGTWDFIYWLNWVMKNYRPHYNINMTAVQVGRDFLNLPTDIVGVGDRKGTIIDSGTTLAYLPEMVYEPLVSKVCNRRVLTLWRMENFRANFLLTFFFLFDILLLDNLSAV